MHIGRRRARPMKAQFDPIEASYESTRFGDQKAFEFLPSFGALLRTAKALLLKAPSYAYDEPAHFVSKMELELDVPAGNLLLFSDVLEEVRERAVQQLDGDRSHKGWRKKPDEEEEADTWSRSWSRWSVL